MTRAAALWDEVAACELELATLEAELEAFHAEYLRAVGALVAEVHALELRIAEASGDPVAAAAAGERARRSAADLKAVPPASEPPPPPTEDLKTLFRRAAKRMHPDLARDPAARGHAEAFMKRLNEAYRAADADGIADLVRQWEASPHAPERPGGDEEEAVARAALEAARRRLQAARDSDVNRLLERSHAAALRGEDLLADLKAQWTAALQDRRTRLAALRAAARPPEA